MVLRVDNNPSSLTNLPSPPTQPQPSRGTLTQVLRIDRDQPGMDVVCAKRGVSVFPTLQAESRGLGDGVVG
jgi:hypothetical protein